MKGKQAPSILVDHLEVCGMLGVRPNTWHKRVVRGQAPAPHSVMGHLSYYRRADIDHFIRTGRWPARMRFRGRATTGDVDPAAGAGPGA